MKPEASLSRSGQPPSLCISRTAAECCPSCALTPAAALLLSSATYFPADVIRTKTKEISASLKKELDIRVPGLLVIDTPGHESFSNLRSRGSGLCDIAILVVDIMHGLEPQTLESIGLLKMRKTPFVVALNKVDRCYDWQATANGPFRPSLAKQRRGTQDEFDKRAKDALMALTEQGLNTALYYDNPDFRKYVSVIPTSAITGEGQQRSMHTHTP